MPAQIAASLGEDVTSTNGSYYWLLQPDAALVAMEFGGKCRLICHP